MALETVVFQQDPFTYSHKDSNFYNLENFHDYGFGFEGYYNNWDSSNSSIAQSYNNNNNNNSSSEVCTTGFLPVGCSPVENTVVSGRGKRRRTKCSKNKEELENQRMTHIAVERNRRRQMNDYLAILRSLMPPSYAQRGDQASIVGGSINFVKELEQLLQFLETHKQVTKNQPPNFSHTNPFSKFFTFPQYSTGNNSSLAATTNDEGSTMMEERQSAVADIEVTMVESHANVKVLSRRRPKQLLKIVNWLQAMCLTILHLTVTTADHMVLYTFSVKVEDNCQLNTVTEIATAVHEMVGMIKEEAMSC
ncbi:transcription factor bHLH96-like [Lycium barbarum]|uniref:transcription factor bHLH96-like n=1 Tax=Lycium barbarum TaxID=112863 RepID=UPI00293F14B1|nr:transcription factor bHLH96-like [Lycium barbarum]